jgi:hypothetical protein
MAFSVQSFNGIYANDLLGLDLCKVMIVADHERQSRQSSRLKTVCQH